MEKFAYSMANICRVCESNKSLMNLTKDKNRSVLKKLRACADIDIDANDELPKYLCTTCVESLDLAYKFKIKCEYTDQKFREQILLMKNVESLGENEPTETKIKLELNELKSVHNIEIINQQPALVELNGVCFEDYTNLEQLIEVTEEEEESNVIVEIEEQNDNKSDIIDKDELLVVNQSQDIRANEDGTDRNLIENEHSNESVFENENQIEYDDDDDGFMINENNEDSSNDGYDESQYIEEDDEEEEAEPGDNGEVFEGYCDEEMVEDEEEIYLNDELTEDDQVTSSSTNCLKITKHKTFICDTCNMEFTNFFEFNKHKKTHGSQRYQCPICDRWFSKKYHMKNHLTIHQGDKLFNCALCEKRYTNQGNLDRHVRVFHYKEKAHVCDQCGKGFSQSTILRQHYSVHIDERNYECEICHKTYKTKEYLHLHKLRHLPPKERPYCPPKKKKIYKTIKKICVCTECGKKSNSVASHQNHMRTHTGEKPYECYECNKTFSFQQSLKNHILLHTGEKPFKCDLCGLAFRQIGHLKGHKLIHTGLKEHTCMVCMKSFALRGNLTVHMRLHTGETPYHCEYCPKKFYDSNGLKRHRQTHTRNGNQKTMQQPNDFIEEEVQKIEYVIHKDDREILVPPINTQENIVIDIE